MTTFILWGEQFDEELAVIFAGRLRGAGLAAQLVGVHGRQAMGSSGILLGCDMTLGAALALACRCAAVIVPGHTPHLRCLELDPRLPRFLATAQRHGAMLITGSISPDDAALFPCPPHRLHMCCERTLYGAAADTLVRTLRQQGAVISEQ